MGDPQTETGSHLTGDGDASKRHLTNPAQKLTITAIDSQVMKVADDMHDGFIEALNKQREVYSNPELCAKRYLAQWVDALARSNPSAYELTSAREDLDTLMYANHRFLDLVNEEAESMGEMLMEPSYVSAVKAMGPPGMEKFARHVQGLSETIAGRQWIRSQINKTNPRDEDEESGGAQGYGFDGEMHSYFDIDDFDIDRSLWWLMSDPTALNGWLMQIAPRRADPQAPPDDTVPPDTDWVSIAEQLVDNTFFSTFAEFAAVIADEKGAKFLDTAIEALAPRIGLRHGLLTEAELSARRDTFKKSLRSVDVIAESTIADDKNIANFAAFTVEKEFWENVGVKAEAIGAALVVVNALNAVTTFVEDPSLYNGVNLASAMTSVMTAFQAEMPLWLRPGRVLSADEADAAAALNEVASRAAAEEGSLSFLAREVSQPEGGKLIPVLGVMQGVFDAIGSYWDMENELEAKNVGGAVASGVAGTGGVLMAIGSLMILSGESTAMVGGLPLGAVLFVVGNIAELVGALVATFFPTLTDLQKWVHRTCFGPSPSGTLAEQIGALTQIIYQPSVSVTRPDPTQAIVEIEIVIPGLRRGSAIPILNLTLEQEESKVQYAYAPLREGGDYGSAPSPEPQFADDGSLQKIVIRAPLTELTILTVGCAIVCDPAADHQSIELQCESDPTHLVEDLPSSPGQEHLLRST